MNFLLFLLVLLLLAYSCVTGFLFDSRNDKKSLVLSFKSDLTSFDELFEPEFRVRREADSSIELISFKVECNIRYRYSRTYVTSHVRNTNANKAKEVTFQVILPETAFISKFFMEIDGKTYEAYVKEKDEAKREYVQAQTRGQSAGLLELNARHSNVFNVNVNIKANTIINFNLTYEELLSRRFGRYEQIININGGEISKTNDVEVVVDIEESQGLKMVKALNIQNELDPPEIGNSENPDAKITKPAANRAHIVWRPTSKFENLKRFIVQYDTNRELDSGEVLIMNGYFVHFFAPPGLKALQKHVIFVLDVSGSMTGRKILQLQEAMRKILSELKYNDYFNIIVFSTDVMMWAPGDIYQETGSWEESYEVLNTFQPFPANKANLEKAKMYIDSLIANGGTNINDALLQALDLTSRIKKSIPKNTADAEEQSSRITRLDTVNREVTEKNLPSKAETLILFLTDGEPTEGEIDTFQIQRDIKQENKEFSIPIFSLAFGSGADFEFLKRLSLQNYGFARKIYEAADAALQLESFYSEISSPLLSNVEFNYTTSETPYSVQEVTRLQFPTYFKGGEIVVAGKIEQPHGTTKPLEMKTQSLNMETSYSLMRYTPTKRCYFYGSIYGRGYTGGLRWSRPVMFTHNRPWWCEPPRTTTTTPRPEPTQEDNFLERLWAYLTIKNLIESDMVKSSESDESPKQKALRLALKYGFVTAQTSLVVVKPEATDVADAESADSKRGLVGGMSPSNGGSRSRLTSFSKTSPSHSGPSFDAEMDEEMDDPYEEDVESKTEELPSQPTTIRQLTIKDIKWLKGVKFTMALPGGKNKEYLVAITGKEISNSRGVGRECTILKSFKMRDEGRCEHLKNCIIDEFVNDFDVYKRSYFCPLTSNSSSAIYAGVCCP